jgi:hypothetical protein
MTFPKSKTAFPAARFTPGEGRKDPATRKRRKGL